MVLINFDTGTNSKDNKFIVNSPNIHLGLKIDNDIYKLFRLDQKLQ